MVQWTSNAILSRGHTEIPGAPPGISNNHLMWELTAFVLMCYCVYLADSKPFPFIRKFKIDGQKVPSNDFEVQSGPFGKHIYMTSHGIYMQLVHQTCSFVLATVLWASGDDPAHTPVLPLLTFLLRVTTFLGPYCAILSFEVTLLFWFLVKGTRTFQADSFFLWKKYGFANYEAEILAHYLLTPVALIDILLLRPFYYQNGPYILYSLQDAFNFHTFMTMAVPAYYIGFIALNNKLTGMWPYDVLYDVQKIGVKGWVVFCLVIVLFTFAWVLAITFAMPENMYLFAF